MTRIAILDQQKCRIQDCGKECMKYCPPMRSGTDTIVIDPVTKKPRIIEDLCEGEGICVKKCPFHAIQIINLPESFDADITHRYSANSFKLHRLPLPRSSLVTGLVGQNGAGKSTSLNILAGEIMPNLGRYDDPPDWEEIIRHYRGSELQHYFARLASKEAKVVIKPQGVDKIPRSVKGKVGQLLVKVAGLEEKARQVVHELELENVWDRDIRQLSGGELQKMAIAAAILRDAEVYLFDEPSSYLDVRERMRVARIIRELKEEGKTVIVVEHDLALLDYMSDQVCLYYGEPGAFGVVTKPHSVREGINIFLDGYIPEENMRFRPEPITFRRSSTDERVQSHRIALVYGDMTKEFESFKLKIKAGEVRKGEVIGILGPNGIGKTTFIKILSGIIEPTTSSMPLQLQHAAQDFDTDFAELATKAAEDASETSAEDENSETQGETAEEDSEEAAAPTKLRVSYKPQYINTESTMTVQEFLTSINRTVFSSNFMKSELIRPLRLEKIAEQELNSLSGGELQKVAIAACLARQADIYLLDEPSAYISAEDRVAVAKVINRMIAHLDASAFVVEHDLMMLAYLSDQVVVFSGEPGSKGTAYSPTSVRVAMNKFLKSMEITFREDPQTGRPRVNKPGSRLDKEQKQEGRYYI